MKTDREKALEYLSENQSPGNHVTAKQIGEVIQRKKSETLRVVNWLVEAGFLRKISAGPQTCYMVEDHPAQYPANHLNPKDPFGEMPESDTMRNIRELPKPAAVLSLPKDEEILDGHYPMDLEAEVLKHMDQEAALQTDRVVIEGLEAKPALKPESDPNVYLKEMQAKTNKNLAQKYFVLSVRIQDELEKVQKYISHTKDFHDNLKRGGRPDLIDSALLLKLEGEKRVLESLARDL